MKKFFLFAALACTVFASCQKEDAPVSNAEGQQKVAFSAFSKAMTKGVLGDGTFDESRTIKVAGIMETAGQYVDFLEPTDFTKNTTSGFWEATDAYYPIGGEDNNFSFLAYSETTPGDDEGTEKTFARWYGSSQVELQVSDKSAKNEIVYSGFKGAKNTAATAAFKRTQALVTVYMHPAPDDEGLITINEIGFKDVKTSGTLLLTIDPKSTESTAPDAKCEWLFNAGCNCAFAKMGNYNLGADADKHEGDANDWKVPQNCETKFEVLETTTGLKVALSAEGFVLDRLFPAQEVEAATMIINYSLGGVTNEVELKLAEAKIGGSTPGTVIWAKGGRYVYDITVNVSEIIIDPSAPDAWEVKKINGTYDPLP